MMKPLSAKTAAELDASLMSTLGYTLEQLMELAGLSVAQSIYKEYNPIKYPNATIICGPGNNGGDGLAAARHLKLFGYEKINVIYPIKGKNPFYDKLITQLKMFNIEVNDKLNNEILNNSNLIIDSMFGFSFYPPLRDPFDSILSTIIKSKNENNDKKIIAVDIPSGWDVDDGPIKDSITENYMPDMLISLTAPKPCSLKISPITNHYLGGRFISKNIADKWGFEVPNYKGVDQCIKLN